MVVFSFQNFPSFYDRFPFLARPSFIITIVIKKVIVDGLLYSLRCRQSVGLSLCPHRRTYPNLVDLRIYQIKGLFTRNTKVVVQILS
jgi:hypothetical protein